MASENKIILEAFCATFNDFMSDMLRVFPDEEGIFKMKHTINSITKLDPKSLMIYWKYYAIGKYSNQVEAGDIDFFVNKNYSEEINAGSVGQSAEKILYIIDNLREKIKNMSNTNRSHVIKYMQNLTKLSLMYKG